MRSPVWKAEEILSMPATGNWCYGLVRDGWRLRIAEVFPGQGFATGLGPRSPRELWWLVKDVARSCR